MLVVFCGDDVQKAEEAFLVAAEGVPRLDLESLEAGDLEELARHRDLFGNAVRYACRGALPREAKLLAQSPNTFIFLTDELSAALKKELSKHGAELCEYNLSVKARQDIEREEKREAARIYKVSDALLARDRRGLWVAYQRALTEGFDPEELYWKLSWQIKNILIASQASSATEAGLHPFVFQKSRGALAKYDKEELIALSGTLLDLWRDTHSGRKELPIALEQFILSV